MPGGADHRSVWSAMRRKLFCPADAGDRRRSPAPPGIIGILLDADRLRKTERSRAPPPVSLRKAARALYYGVLGRSALQVGFREDANMISFIEAYFGSVRVAQA